MTSYVGQCAEVFTFGVSAPLITRTQHNRIRPSYGHNAHAHMHTIALSSNIHRCRWQFYTYTYILRHSRIISDNRCQWNVSILFYYVVLFLSANTIGPLINKQIKKKMTKKNSIGQLSLSVCLFVCASVSALQVTVFVVGSWFLAKGILAVNTKNTFFCVLKFWDLTYLWLF